MRFKRQKNMIRVFGDKHDEIAYAIVGISGLEAKIEFPSDWHEHCRAWVNIGLGFGKVCFSFPYSKTVPDEMQCSGPTYGFAFFEDLLFLYYGKNTGRGDKIKAIRMPWYWNHKEHKILSEPETHDYTYTLKSGEVQHRKATINAESRAWARFWVPFKRTRKTINIDFSDEVGERSGSWKGGCTGCSYEMKNSETPIQTLRRMEIERKF